jgi:hypothetical protein
METFELRLKIRLNGFSVASVHAGMILARDEHVNNENCASGIASELKYSYIAAYDSSLLRMSILRSSHL